jgi:hypothetical protein
MSDKYSPPPNMVLVSYNSPVKLPNYKYRLDKVDTIKKEAYFTPIVIRYGKITSDKGLQHTNKQLSIKDTKFRRFISNEPMLTYSNFRMGRVGENNGFLDQWIFLTYGSEKISLKDFWEFCKEKNIKGHSLSSEDVLYFLTSRTINNE